MVMMMVHDTTESASDGRGQQFTKHSKANKGTEMNAGRGAVYYR